MIDNNRDIGEICLNFKLTRLNIEKHISDNHRETLMAWGIMDYTVRKYAINAGNTLGEFIDKWQKGLVERTPKSIKDSDALKAIELYSKLAGELTDKHEVTIKHSIEDALKEYLSEDEEKKET